MELTRAENMQMRQVVALEKMAEGIANLSDRLKCIETSIDVMVG